VLPGRVFLAEPSLSAALPTGRLLFVTAHVTADEGRYLRIEGTIRKVGADEPITLAAGKFYPALSGLKTSPTA
jgi:hypothetical protein